MYNYRTKWDESNEVHAFYEGQKVNFKSKVEI